MRSPAWLLPVALVFGCIAVTCGGTVVVDHAGGEGGSGSSVDVGTTATVGPGTSVTTGPNTTSVTTGPTTSTSTGTPTGVCDGTADCIACQECALYGGPCTTLWEGCMGDASCSGLINCMSNCFDDMCLQECWESYPEAQDLYLQLFYCVVCDACYGDCDGSVNGC